MESTYNADEYHNDIETGGNDNNDMEMGGNVNNETDNTNGQDIDSAVEDTQDNSADTSSWWQIAWRN